MQDPRCNVRRARCRVQGTGWNVNGGSCKVVRRALLKGQTGTRLVMFQMTQAPTRKQRNRPMVNPFQKRCYTTDVGGFTRYPQSSTLVRCIGKFSQSQRQDHACLHFFFASTLQGRTCVGSGLPLRASVTGNPLHLPKKPSFRSQGRTPPDR